MLTKALLDELQATMCSLGADVAQRWRPPREDFEVAEELTSLGLSVPAELAVWWAWHDGVLNEGARTVGLAWQPLPVDGAAAATRLHRELTDREPAMPVWSPTWIEFCFDGARGALACESNVAPGEPSPVYVYFADDVALEQPAMPSIEALVQFWIDAMRDGTLRVDGSGEFAYLSPADKERARGRVGDLL